jgi:hypothetical protein
MENSKKSKDSSLEAIFEWLDLNACEGRLKLKANLLKRTIYLCSQWKKGKYDEWVNRLSVRLCLDARKVHEGYLYPLVVEGIFKCNGNGSIEYVGLPSDVDKANLEARMKEEYEEDAWAREQLGKPPITFKQWQKERTRQKRYPVIG